jgi:predicted MFS family arabinose efflux permease
MIKLVLGGNKTLDTSAIGICWPFSELSGLGYSLVFPGFVEAFGVPQRHRDLAIGAYQACLDLALGLASPVLGLLASWPGLSRVFLASALVVLCAASIATYQLRASQVPRAHNV